MPDADPFASGTVMTVTGSVAAALMGVTLPHEHLLLNHTEGTVELSDPDLIAAELARFRQAGGRTLVELTNGGLRRDPRGLKAIAERTGVQVVMGCGYYKYRWHPPDMDSRSVDDLTEEMVRDLTLGADGESGIRAGVIGELGVSEFLHPNEEKVLRAGAAAHRVTGAALSLHVHLHDKVAEERLRMEVLDLLEGAGVAPGKVIMGHCEPSPGAVNYHERLARRGAYVEFDLLGMQILRGDRDRAYREESAAVGELAARGWLDRLLLSQDVCMNALLVAHGGWGYAHVINDVLPAIRAIGLTEEELRVMTVDNPRRVFPTRCPDRAGEEVDRVVNR